ncbi:hypothetical protein ACFQPG_07705 [Sphingomonas sp. GCM10030256]|uniref:hypothetical protein n=1 Tax=Sphingomonas sp. GCM10030256 TaxID=3273427 RepID=UPI00362455FA
MLSAFSRRRPSKPARYHFYVWEDGNYRPLSPCELPSDAAAADFARQQVGEGAPVRPASLDAPHLHVVREDGVHIITVDLPERADTVTLAKVA